MHVRPTRLLPALALAGLLAILAAACGGGSSSSAADTSGSSDESGDPGTLTLFSAQHEAITEALAHGFEAQSGATVQIRYGEDEGLAAQIEQEGGSSAADVVLTENTPPLESLSEKGLLAPVEESTLAAVPSQYSSPNGDWVGVVARETVMIYDPKQLAADELPASILDLAKPEWKGRLAIAPSEPDFVPVVSAITKLDGEDAARTWLEGFAANARKYNDNEGIVAAVDSGQVTAGIINHYYWFEEVAEKGKANVAGRLHYFGNEDPGALVDISGAAALGSASDPQLAQGFLAYADSAAGQKAIVESGDWEYPLRAGVAAPAGVKPFASLDPPPVTPADLGDGSEPLLLMQEAGLL